MFSLSRYLPPAQQWREYDVFYSTSSSSTTKMSAANGGMEAPAPRSP